MNWNKLILWVFIYVILSEAIWIISKWSGVVHSSFTLTVHFITAYLFLYITKTPLAVTILILGLAVTLHFFEGSSPIIIIGFKLGYSITCRVPTANRNL